MKKLNYSFLRAMVALAVGLILVVFPSEAGNYIVIAIGLLFFVPSIVSIVHYFIQKEKWQYHFPLESIGALLFGTTLMIEPGFFANFLTFLLGFILVMCGIQQLASLIAARHWIPVPTVYFIMPMVVLLAGLFAVFNPLQVRSYAFIVIGITSICYAVFEIISWVKFTRHRPLLKENNKVIEVSETPILKQEEKQEDF